MDSTSLNKEKLAELLKEARKAHRNYEEILGGPDDDWAIWYADFIIKKLNQQQTLGQLQPAAAAPQLNTKPLDGEKVPESDKLASPAPAPSTEMVMQVCPSCAYHNRPGVLFCENCGTNLTTGEKAALGTRDLREPEEEAAPDGKAPTESADEPKKPIKPLNTIRLETSEAQAVRTAGSTQFEDHMSLRVEIEGGATPIILKPKSEEMILGRRDPTTGATPEVDLTPYAGYRMGVSRRHASIKLGETQLNLWDLGSSNGTFLNGTRLTAHRPYPIRDGDEVRLGQMILRLFFQSDGRTQ